MKNTFKLTALPLLLLIATGCGIYNPACVDIPLVREKGELQLEGAVLPLDYDEILPRVSMAYGITDRLAAAVSLDPYRGYSQAMAGAYFPVGEKFVWEVYGGGGIGAGRVRNYSHGYYTSSGKYGLTFVQIDGGWRNLTRFLNLDIAFSLKTGWLRSHLDICDGWSYYQDSLGVEHSYLAYHNATDNSLLVEPTVEVRFGWPNFKFNMKMGYCYHFGNEYSRMYGDIGIGFGMSYRFRTNKKTK